MWYKKNIKVCDRPQIQQPTGANKKERANTPIYAIQAIQKPVYALLSGKNRRRHMLAMSSRAVFINTGYFENQTINRP